jgi:NADPH:quinone reductase-like Zn-dependent oxidoreductase
MAPRPVRTRGTTCAGCARATRPRAARPRAGMPPAWTTYVWVDDIDKTFPFDQTLEALAYVEQGRANGKVVITLD